MCGPALPLVAAGMAAAGAITGGLSANAQARYQARIAERNAGMEREAAQQAQLNTREAALEQYRKMGAIQGAQRARAAANGVSVDWGTAAAVQADTQLLGREDVRRIYDQGAQQVRGFEIQASNFLGEASARRQEGTAALVKGVFDAGSSILGGAQQYKNLKPQTYSRGYDGIY